MIALEDHQWTYDPRWIARVDDWIQAEGDTLRAYIEVPQLLPYLDQALFNDVQAFRRGVKHVQDRDEFPY